MTMKKLLFYLSLFFIITSCSKKVEFSGNIKGTSPLDRIEFIEASGVATLPLVNVGINPDGSFKGEFIAPKNGIYLMTYGENQQLIYIKKGQKLHLQGDAFSENLNFLGDAKNNNVFLIKVQQEMMKYVDEIKLETKLELPQDSFIKEIRNFHKELINKTKTIAENQDADAEVVDWKLDDIRVGILDILFKYRELNNTPPNSNFIAYEKELKSNEDKLIEEFPAYRSHLLNELTEEFDAYFKKNGKGSIDAFASEIFVEFLKTKPQLSDTAKDYLTAFVMAQMDITQQTEPEKIEKIKKIIKKDIHNKSVQKDLLKVVKALGGLKIGEKAPNSSLLTVDDKSVKISDFKGKPVVLIFYSSWTPHLIEQVESFTELVDFYKNELTFLAVNFDDTKEQFKKTSAFALNGVAVQNVYAESGLSSEIAKDYFIYGFKLKPTYMVLDKDGKVASPFFFYIDDKRFIQRLDQLSGLNYNAESGKATLQNQLFNPEATD